LQVPLGGGGPTVVEVVTLGDGVVVHVEGESYRDVEVMTAADHTDKHETDEEHHPQQYQQQHQDDDDDDDDDDHHHHHHHQHHHHHRQQRQKHKVEWRELSEGGLLVGEVFAAVGVRSADVTGKSDPYLIYRVLPSTSAEENLAALMSSRKELKMSPSSRRSERRRTCGITRVCEGTLFPEWNHPFRVVVDPGMCRLGLVVYDRDKGRSDDYLGHVILDRLPTSNVVLEIPMRGCKKKHSEHSKERHGSLRIRLHFRPTATATLSQYDYDVHSSDDPRVAFIYHLLQKKAKTVVSELNHSDTTTLNRVFALASPTELDLLSQQLKLSDLVSLIHSRLGEFTPSAKRAVVDLLQRQAGASGKFSSTAQECVKSLFLSSEGRSLTRFKILVDGGGDHYDLMMLLKSRLSSSVRDEILAHIWSESEKLNAADTEKDKQQKKEKNTETSSSAAASASSASSGEASSRRRQRARRVKILSDIDDTFYASLNDNSYARGTVYPGVVALYRGLDYGVRNKDDKKQPNTDEEDSAQAKEKGEDKDEDEEDLSGDLAFLSARPEMGGLFEDLTHSALRSKGIREATLLCGSLATVHSNEAMAAKKLENFLFFHRLYPEYDFVLFGDSGQGDILLGEAMLSRPECEGKVRGVFIHDVVSSTGKPHTSEADRATLLAEKGIYLFDSYLEAAVECYRRGLLDLEHLRVVELKATLEFAEAAPRIASARLRQLAADQLQHAQQQMYALLRREQQ